MKYILQVIRGQRRAPLLRPVLTLCSQGYRAAVFLRNKAYDCGLLSTTRLNATVVSIGNIAACGTGKTPFTHLLASHLSPLKVAILTRGFKSAVERMRSNQRVSQDGSAAHFGDEPLLLARKTGLPVWVGPDRIVSGHLAIAEGANCLILDDGMQHRRLHRDVEIVLVDAEDPLCQRRFLPRGLLRDSPCRLASATLLVANGVRDAAHYAYVQQQLAPFSSAPVVGVCVRVLNPPAHPAKVGVFCGIGHPERFLQTVRDLNQEIVDTLICGDHEAPSEAQLRRFAEGCLEKGAQRLLCTEKDAVKCPALSLPLPVVPLEMGLQIVYGESHFKQLIERI